MPMWRTWCGWSLSWNPREVEPCGWIGEHAGGWVGASGLWAPWGQRQGQRRVREKRGQGPSSGRRLAGPEKGEAEDGSPVKRSARQVGKDRCTDTASRVRGSLGDWKSLIATRGPHSRSGVSGYLFSQGDPPWPLATCWALVRPVHRWQPLCAFGPRSSVSAKDTETRCQPLKHQGGFLSPTSVRDAYSCVLWPHRPSCLAWCCLYIGKEAALCSRAPRQPLSH